MRASFNFEPEADTATAALGAGARLDTRDGPSVFDDDIELGASESEATADCNRLPGLEERLGVKSGSVDDAAGGTAVAASGAGLSTAMVSGASVTILDLLCDLLAGVADTCVDTASVLRSDAVVVAFRLVDFSGVASTFFDTVLEVFSLVSVAVSETEGRGEGLDVRVFT